MPPPLWRTSEQRKFHRPRLGATGSIGVHVVKEALAQLVAGTGREQDDLTATFAGLRPDSPGELDAALVGDLVPLGERPARFREDLARVR